MADTNLEKENEQDQTQSSQQSDKEPIITPKENDELYIETEENQSAQEIDEVPDYEAQAEAELSKMEQQKNLKSKGKRAKHVQQKPPREKSPNSKLNKGLIIAIVILVIIGIGGFILVMYPDALAKKFPVLVEKGIIKIQDTTHAVQPAKDTLVQHAKDTAVEQAKPIEQTVETQPQEEVKAAEPKPKKVEKVKEQADVRGEGIIAPKKITQEERIVKKGRIVTPCWLISFSSVSNEATAIKVVAKLTTAGKNCGYYWIPDYVNGGPQLFKVYIGPFTSKDNALKELPQIQEVAQGAYVTELK